MSTTTILETLNAYDGDSIWNDVIFPLGVDWPATQRARNALDPAERDDITVIVLRNGKAFRCPMGQPAAWKRHPWKGLGGNH